MDDRWAVVLLFSIAAAHPVEAQVSVHNATHPGATADKPVKMIQSYRHSEKNVECWRMYYCCLFRTYLDAWKRACHRKLEVLKSFNEYLFS